MAKRSKEQTKNNKQRNDRQREMENAPGMGDKKLDGPNRPST